MCFTQLPREPACAVQSLRELILFLCNLAGEVPTCEALTGMEIQARERIQVWIRERQCVGELVAAQEHKLTWNCKLCMLSIRDGKTALVQVSEGTNL